MRLGEMIYTEEELQQEIRAKESWRDLYREQLEKNKKLKEKLSEITMVADDEKQSIEHILELEKENKKLKEEIDRFKDNAMEDMRVQTKLEEENRSLKEELDAIKRLANKYFCRYKDVDIESTKLKEDILFRDNRISWFEGEEERLNSVINTLKKKLENSVGFWKKKVAKLSEENRQLKHRNEVLDLSLKASVHPLVYNELVGNTETSKSTEGRNS